MDLLHGSGKIVERPRFGEGNPHNDYGLGFYCTQNIDLAREWACTEWNDGFVNKYRLEADGLRVLRLNGGEYNILNWLAILLENRTFDLSTPVSVRARRFILDNYLPDYKDYDIIVGYRADDSYFSFARAFLANGITLEQLGRAMKLGKLGEQVTIRSREAFDRLRFTGYEPVSSALFYPKRMLRDKQARSDYLSMLSENPEGENKYMSDLIDGKGI